MFFLYLLASEADAVLTPTRFKTTDSFSESDGETPEDGRTTPPPSVSPSTEPNDSEILNNIDQVTPERSPADPSLVGAKPSSHSLISTEKALVLWGQGKTLAHKGAVNVGREACTLWRTDLTKLWLWVAFGMFSANYILTVMNPCATCPSANNN